MPTVIADLVVSGARKELTEVSQSPFVFRVFFAFVTHFTPVNPGPFIYTIEMTLA